MNANRSRTRPGREAGFSLVEMAAVLICMGLVAGISYGALNSHMPNARLQASARDLLGELRSARQLAITEGNNYVVTFDLAQKRYRVWDDEQSDGHMSVGESERIVPLAKDVSLHSVSFAGGNRVIFRPNGGVVAGGDVELRCTRQARARINITRATGRIQLTVTD